MDGFRRASTPQSGLKVETVQDARAEISRRCEKDGSGTAGFPTKSTSQSTSFGDLRGWEPADSFLRKGSVANLDEW